MAMTLTTNFDLSLWELNDTPFAESSDELPDGTENTSGRGINDNWRDIDTYLWDIHEGLDMNIQTSKPASIAGLYGTWGFNDTGEGKKTLMLEGYDSVWLVPNNDYLATESYVDQAVAGVSWQDPVLDKELVTSPAPVIGERYIIAGTGGAWSGGTIDDVAECTDDSPETWDFQTPLEGWVSYVDDEDTAYRFNGSGWVKFASMINHNNLANIFGDSEGYHINQADYNAISDVDAQLADLHTDGGPTFETLDVTGKLTVGGLIDPTGIGFTPQATTPLGGLFGFWVDNSAEKYIRTDTWMKLILNQRFTFGTDNDSYIAFNGAGLILNNDDGEGGDIGNGLRLDYNHGATSGITWFNVWGNDIDFSIEGQNQNRIWYMDASVDSMGIRTNLPQERLHMAEGNMLFDDSQKTIWGTGKDTEAFFNPAGYFELINTVGNDELILWDDGNISLYNVTNDVGLGVGASGLESYLWASRSGGGYSQVNVSDSLIWINKAENDTDTRISGDTIQNLLYADASTDRIGIGTNAPTVLFDVNGTLKATILQGNGAAITGITAGSANQVHILIRKASAGTIPTAKPFYIVGYNVGGWYTVEEADANVSAQMPASGITEMAVTNSATVEGAIAGAVINIPTSSWSAADPLYVANGGGLTNVKPTGDDAIQKVGQVGRSHATLGTLLVQGAGRINDLPQIAEHFAWAGNASGVPTAVDSRTFKDERIVFTQSAEPFNSDSSATYAGGELSRFCFPGSTKRGTPSTIKIIAYTDAGKFFDMRIQDVTNANTICEVTNQTNTAPAIIDMGTISNIPAGEAIFELQLQGDGTFYVSSYDEIY